MKKNCNKCDWKEQCDKEVKECVDKVASREPRASRVVGEEVGK